MAKKHSAAKNIGGPGASHENRKDPSKSKPHGELNKLHPKQGNTKRTAQGKSRGGSALAYRPLRTSNARCVQPSHCLIAVSVLLSD